MMGRASRGRAGAPPVHLGRALALIVVLSTAGRAAAAAEDDAPRRPEVARDDVPPVDQLCRLAVEAALAEPERARSFVARARLAGWLPETTLRVYRRFARTEGVTLEDPVTGAAVPVDVKAIDDVRYEWRATWDLSRIVFNPDEIAAHLEALKMADVRRDIQLLVIRLYFERKRLLADAGDVPSVPTRAEDQAAASSAGDRRRLRVLEIEAELDALSRGALSARRRTAAPAASPSP